MGFRYVLIACILSFISIQDNDGRNIDPTAELENYINPDDLKIIKDYFEKNPKAMNEFDLMMKTKSKRDVDDQLVQCYGKNVEFVKFMSNIFSFDMKPASSEAINTTFIFSSRTKKDIQVAPGSQFSLQSIDFDARRKTVVIVHGFMSHGNVDWVKNLAHSYLQLEDVNVIVVDWSAGSNTFKYWRAVASTRTVGKVIANLMQGLKKLAGLNYKNCHFIGHSLGAQIMAFASQELGTVARITGLDPARPCFKTTNLKDRLDPSDADFVEVIHTNAVGFGYSDPSGHVDFYPNGGVRQPGCHYNLSVLQNMAIPYYLLAQAICSHGRSYVLFTETLNNSSCKFLGSPWNLTVAGLYASLDSNYCKENNTRCPEMGIRATKQYPGTYVVITKHEEPYCVTDWWKYRPEPHLVQDIVKELQTVDENVTPKSSTESFFYTWYNKTVGLFQRKSDKPVKVA
ncbi:pancreatic lipase-related protein 2-like [Anticarsia gemmatalis]|uniref:pancreatic lipase-related protein 2-like n=1 Tax=Anticarsia gemmatalis TaxID=129554 RepID=UPI003F766CF6